MKCKYSTCQAATTSENYFPRRLIRAFPSSFHWTVKTVEKGLPPSAADCKLRKLSKLSMTSSFTLFLYLYDFVHMLNKFDADMNLADSEMMISVRRTIEL